MFTANYKNVEFVAPERRYLSLLQAWYDALSDSDVKSAIRAIRWREMRPPIAWFRLVVLCSHPVPEQVTAYRKSKGGGDVDTIERTLTKAMNAFIEWVQQSDVPAETALDDRSAWITWSAIEMPYFDVENFSAQERAQYDLNHQASAFLYLVHLSAQEEEDFVKEMVGSNNPFGAAGTLLTGHVRAIRRFPPDFPGSDAEREQLHENLYENPADFLILMRLAHHFDCKLELVSQVHEARKSFLRENSVRIDGWLKEHARAEEEEDDFSGTEPVLDAATYDELDSAGEKYRQAFVTALEGREHELGDAVNSFLANLPVPDGPFAPELRDEGDWWKQADD